MSNGIHGDGQSPALANRFVLLGASNLTVSLRLVIQLLQRRIGGPSDVLVAAGHGRSYGEFSQVMFRELPGITSSGLWKRLELANVRPTFALLTDIGNDIPYGYTPEQILGWVSWCVSRLQRQSVHIVMTNVPIASIKSISDWRYKMLRSVLFPRCQLSRREVVERASVVHHGLVEMAASKHFELLEPSSDWFGADAIHVHYWKRKAFYQRITEQFSSSNGMQCLVTGNEPWFSMWKQRPHFAYKKVLGRERRNQQPSGQLADGTIISMY